jgi:hypothetical protein
MSTDISETQTLPMLLRLLKLPAFAANPVSYTHLTLPTM